MTAILEHLWTRDVKLAPIHLPTPELFPGQPLRRDLHNVGITILDTAQVKRDQHRFKADYCAQLAEAVTPEEGESRLAVFINLMRTTKWIVVDLHTYRLATAAGVARLPGTNAELPPIPAEVNETIEMAQRAAPGSVVELEAFDKDPYVKIALGKEEYYIGHF